jgi:hypothetical protein
MQLPSPISLSNDLSPQHSFNNKANWLIPNHVLVGEAPCLKQTDFIQDILHVAKCNTFVCLQAEAIPPSEDAIWLGGQKEYEYPLGNVHVAKDSQEGRYGPMVRSMMEDIVASSNKDETHVTRTTTTFLHYGIQDFGIALSLASLEKLIQKLVECIQSGDVLYIHCKAGKGRTGLVAACLLLLCYRYPDGTGPAPMMTMTAKEALQRVSLYCSLRASVDESDSSSYMTSPETEEQRQQVVDFATWIHSKEEG